MAMFNDLFELLADVPRLLVLAWAGWLATGALIVMWYRRADEFEAAFPAPAPRTVSKTKPVSRPPSSPDLHAAEVPAGPHVTADESAAGADRGKPPVVIGDPFGDLATLLDPPAPPAVATEYTPPPAEPPRAPADSPILSSSGSPIRRASSHEPGH